MDQKEEFEKWVKDSKTLIKKMKRNQFLDLFGSVFILFSSVWFSSSEIIFLRWYSKFCLVMSIVLIGLIFVSQYHIDKLKIIMKDVITNKLGGKFDEVK